MRPVSVRFQCFGPYMQEQYVNFEDLEKNGIFLICGETGAGKTTILDAMCYALYGKSSGGLRGGLEVMRCALAGSDDDTIVEFVFDTNGRRYRFTRSLKYKTEKNKKSRNLNDYHNCVELDGEREILIVEKEQDRYVTQKAEELIGLSYDQFRQVIILPQGQFERLLVSDSEHKEEILVSLFHAQRWQQIADEVFNRVSQQDKALKEERRTMDDRLRQYGCQSLMELEEKNQERRGHLEALLEQTQQAEQLLEQAKQDKEQALLENQAFQELKKRELRLASLLGQEDFFEKEQLLLTDAELAQAIRPQYLEYETDCKAVRRADQNARDAAQALREKVKKLQIVQQELQTHLQGKAAVDGDRQSILKLENAKEAYAVLENRKAAVEFAQAAETAAQKAAEKARQEVARCAEQLERAMHRQNAAMQHYQNCQQQYLRGIGAALAQTLKTGQPCPVCGSIEHPAPAMQEPPYVTEQMLNQALQDMNASGEVVAGALNQKTQAEQKGNAAQQTLAQAQRDADMARGDYQQALSQRLEGVETERQRSEMLERLKRRVLQYEEMDTDLQHRLAEAMGGEVAARDLARKADAELAEAEIRKDRSMQKWQQALTESGLESRERYLAADIPLEEKQRRSAALSQFRADLENAREAAREQQAVLAGKSAPDVSGAAKRLTEAENAYRKCVTTQTLAAKQLEDMCNDYRQLEQRMGRYETRRLEVDADLAFARRLRGDSGISLQRYVLGVMMTSVTVEANRLLANVYAGRYRLYRTDEITGRRRKAGLELEVYDSHTNQRRSVTTLSGGEKFLVSLSLAIGLSTVVQAQGGGIRLEAMFIDEGFGSLDRESVADALEVLQGIRRGSGIVGIISHVEQLAEVIPTRLEISKGRHGSTCTLRG